MCMPGVYDIQSCNPGYIHYSALVTQSVSASNFIKIFYLLYKSVLPARMCMYYMYA